MQSDLSELLDCPTSSRLFDGSIGGPAGHQGGTRIRCWTRARRTSGTWTTPCPGVHGYPKQRSKFRGSQKIVPKLMGSQNSVPKFIGSWHPHVLCGNQGQAGPPASGHGGGKCRDWEGGWGRQPPGEGTSQGGRRRRRRRRRRRLWRFVLGGRGVLRHHGQPSWVQPAHAPEPEANEDHNSPHHGFFFFKKLWEIFELLFLKIWEILVDLKLTMSCLVAWFLFTKVLEAIVARMWQWGKEESRRRKQAMVPVG